MFDLRSRQEVIGQRREDVTLGQCDEVHRLILGSISDAVFVTDDSSGAFTYVSPGVSRIFGYSRDEVASFSHVSELLGEGMLSLDELSTRGELQNIEREVLDKDGNKHVLLVNVKRVSIQGGTILYCCRDITEQKATEEALRRVNDDLRERVAACDVGFRTAREQLKGEMEERARLATAIEQVADGVILTGTDWTIQYVSPGFERMTGYSRDEIIGQHLRILKSGKHEGAFYRNIRNALSNGGGWSGRILNRKKDGTLYESEVTGSPVRDASGMIINYVAIHRDITHMAKLEKQLQQAQKMEAIGTLAGGIAHDFNNILAVIVGCTELSLLQIPKESRTCRHLTEVLKAGERATELVQQILTFSRKREIERKPLRLGSLCKEVLKMLRSSLPSTVEIRQDISSHTGVALVDATQIHQVLMNLCTNAAHAMREKGGILRVSLANVDLGEDDPAAGPGHGPRPYVRLTVSDTGHGMSQDVLDRMFDPYFTSKKPGEGTGLGLAVVHGIVESYGGFMRVHSAPGQGATFHVFIPRIEDMSGEEGAEVAPALPRGSESILLVDDEEPFIRVCRELLVYLGYQVDATTSSTEALKVFKMQPHKYDLVITDHIMPGLIGTELAQELLRIRPDIPVILCTGFSDSMAQENANCLGVRSLIMKPLVAHALAEKVREVLDRDRQ